MSPAAKLGSTFALLTCINFLLSGVEAKVFNFSQCAIDANDTYWKAPNDSFLYDPNGFHTMNQSLAWGISYESCTRICRPSAEVFNWNGFSQSFVSCLLPWLALMAQLPFATNDQQSDFLVLILALGSPALIAYSLVLTILNVRTINRMFRELKEDIKLYTSLDSLRPLRRPELF